MTKTVDLTICNRLIKERRDLNVYHHSKRSSHIISCNNSLTRPVKPVEADDYLHISVARGPGYLTDYCVLDLPAFMDFKISLTGEATVFHSVNGSFAIRQGPWKLIMCGGSGGWSHPTPKEVKAEGTLPAIQLYNLETDPSEEKNLQAEHPDIVDELKTLLIKYYRDGRSTPGQMQRNDPSLSPRKEPAFLNASS